MTEGFWINFKMGANGKVVPIHEHETDIRNPAIYKKLGIDEATAKTFSKYKVGKDREAFMTMLMEKFPLIRVRGHGNQVTFEYAHWGRSSVMSAILKFGDDNLSDFNTININNLSSGEGKSMTFGEFKEKLEEEGAEGIMRTGAENIDEELDKIDKEVKNAKSKNMQKAISQVRKTWGFNPKTRVKDSDKKYKRNKSKDIPLD